MKQLVIIIIAIFAALSANAYYFRSYQVEDGLSHNSVWAVMQDSRGFLWFGTNDGLNRFDSKMFKVFRHIEGDTSSIGNNFIHCLKEDTQGRFFVGTKKGLYLYDFLTEHFRRVNLNRPAENDASINAVFETPEGSIYVATHGQGLYVLDADLTVKKHYTRANGGLPCEYIWTVVQDYVGNTWLGTASEGLVLFDTQKETFTAMKDERDFEIKDQAVNSLYCDIDYNLWVGTVLGGLYRYNYRTGKVYNYMKREAMNIKSIVEYSDTELIVGCERGLVVFDRKKGTFRLLNDNFDNMTDYSIFSIYSDAEGAFWIGTYFGGVNYFSPSINRFSYYYNSPPNSLKKNIVSSFAQDDNGKIWIGSYNDGMSLFNPQTGCFEDTRIVNDYHNIQDIYCDNGKLYVSLYGSGISIWDSKNRTKKNLFDLPDVQRETGDFVTTIFKTSKGDFLFCSEDRTSRYNPQTQTAERIEKLAGVPVKGVAEDHTGALWFACHAVGLMRLNAGGSWKSFVLPNNNVNCVYQDSKFRIWIGTEGSGMSLFNPKTEQFEQAFSRQNGLPSDIVYSILDDSEGNIWATTSGGLIKIDAGLKTIKRFGYLDDIQKIRYNPKAALRAMDNRLYFGGTNGFIAFNPKDITVNLKEPPLVMTDFQIAGRNVEKEVNLLPFSNIVLERSQSTFTLDFVALSYVSPRQNCYAYILEGFDSDWTSSGDNKARYMNIPAGNYVFKVKASNNDGVWGEEQSVNIRIKPHILASVLMILLYIVLGLAILSYALWSYKKKIEAKNQEKIYKYKTEKEKEIYQTKIDFFTNIAHEIRTPLSLITAPLESIIVSNDGNEKTRNNLDIIKINVNRLLELINQLLDFRKVEENMFHYKFACQDVGKIVRSVYEQYVRNAKLNNIEMTLESITEIPKSTVDKEAIYKIVSNLISNAIKYAKSKIEIRMESCGDNIYISVKDDGVGVDKKYLSRIFEPFFQMQETGSDLKTGTGLGLSLSKSLAEKHNGDIRVESTEGKGCIFILRIPVVESTIEQKSSAELKSPGTEIPAASDRKIKILIAEDNRDLRDFLVNSLRDNYIVFGAENGAEALPIIEKENIDLIISDIMMPEMDGLELCRRVKTDLSCSHIPLILLSAKTDTPAKIEGLNNGADVYIEKPFSFEQLKAQINSIIENRNNIRNNFIKSPLLYFKQNSFGNDNGYTEFIEKLNAHILENIADERFSIDVLSGLFNMSRSNFHKKIKSLTDMTPNDYINLIRLKQSAQLLAGGKYKINEVCYMVGFNTPSYFSKLFYEHFGKLPKEYIGEM
jgi:signal transduction histidine kinase/ligand-binding sensor domain-containing protein/AraC-like DNA-binding protein/ActR/RegA family two-component response regulator